MAEIISQELQELVREAYRQPEVIDLEQRILDFDNNAMCNELLKPAMRGMLLERRDALNARFVYTGETARLLREFNSRLKSAILEARDRCLQVSEGVRANAPFGKEESLEVWTCVDFAGYPALHPVQPDEVERRTVWECIASDDYDTLTFFSDYGFEYFRDWMCEKDDNRLFGLSAPDDNWNEHLPAEWSRGMGLVMQFHSFYCHSFMSLYDLIFIRDYTIRTIIEYSQNHPHKK